MENALELYKNRQFDKALAKRELADSLFCTYDNQLNVDLENDKTLYGDNINLGLINHIVNQNIKELTNNGNIQRDNVSFIKTYANALKTNPNCKAQYNIYDKLSKDIDPSYCDEYIDLILSTYMPQVCTDRFIEDNRTLLPQLRSETPFNEYIHVEDLDIDLYSTIESLIQTYNSPEHFQSYIEHKKSLSNILRQKYSNQPTEDNLLTPDELDLIHNIDSMDREQQQETFETLKQQVKEKIKDKITDSELDDIQEWINIYKKIEEKQFNQENTIVDISELTELINTLNTKEG